MRLEDKIHLHKQTLLNIVLLNRSVEDSLWVLNGLDASEEFNPWNPTYKMAIQQLIKEFEERLAEQILLGRIE